MKKAAVCFYSYSGNTRKIALALQKELSAQFQTDIIEIKALDEADSFFGQCVRALRKKQAQIKEDISLDVRDYDLIALGTPVWAFGMAPSMRTYMNKCTSFESKDIIIFATYGSGVGKDKCLNEMEKIAEGKSAKAVRRFLIQQNNTADEQFVRSRIKEIL
ncbi:MAG: NAD(P)H-dependent oxidoreductase [Candidatus Omnitrophota bacterium]